MPADTHAGGAESRAIGEASTLEAFRQSVDPDAFYSEREHVSLYIETYPSATSLAIDRKVVRNRHLRHRQDVAPVRMEASLVKARS
uniref:hypothetical protein n=1 Tax=Burkholderia arboris TaxID=488730 RepID=UPI003BEEE740